MTKNLINKLVLVISQKKNNRLEITSTIGCAMMCDYCPQTLIGSVAKTQNLNRKMSFEDFKIYMSNVPKSTQIHWTGYSEPLAHDQFEDFVLYLDKKGYRQLISTTMFGRRHTENFMSKFSKFISITFHLPDNQNLMKLKVSERYIETLEKAIKFQSTHLKKNIYFVVFGNDFHPLIKNLLNKMINQNYILKENIDLRKHLNSRSEMIDVNKLDKSNVNNFYKNEWKKDEIYYCSYLRLNQGVLLPDGNVNLCCNDYSVGAIIGSLNNTKLDKIYNQEKILSEDFIYGKNSVCKKCEYYKTI